MDFESIMLSERIQLQKIIYRRIPFIWNTQNRQIRRDRNYISSSPGLGLAKEEGMTSDWWWTWTFWALNRLYISLPSPFQTSSDNGSVLLLVPDSLSSLVSSFYLVHICFLLGQWLLSDPFLCVCPQFLTLRLLAATPNSHFLIL